MPFSKWQIVQTKITCIARSAIFCVRLLGTNLNIQSIFICFLFIIPCRFHTVSQVSIFYWHHCHTTYKDQALSTDLAFHFSHSKISSFTCKQNFCCLISYSFGFLGNERSCYSRHTCSRHNISSRLFLIRNETELATRATFETLKTQTKLLLYLRDKLF